MLIHWPVEAPGPLLCRLEVDQRKGEEAQGKFGAVFSPELSSKASAESAHTSEFRGARKLPPGPDFQHCTFSRRA